MLTSLLLAGLVSTHGLVLAPAAASPVAQRAASAQMLFGWGAKKEAAPPNTAGLSARDADFARRQGKLDARRAKGAELPKGSVEVTFPQKGNKVVVAKQGQPIGQVISKAGLRVKFDCKVRACPRPATSVQPQPRVAR